MTDNFTRGPQITEAEAIAPAVRKCCQCEEPLAGKYVYHWGRGHYACAPCNADDANDYL